MRSSDFFHHVHALGPAVLASGILLCACDARAPCARAPAGAAHGAEARRRDAGGVVDSRVRDNGAARGLDAGGGADAAGQAAARTGQQPAPPPERAPNTPAAWWARIEKAAPGFARLWSCVLPGFGPASLVLHAGSGAPYDAQRPAAADGNETFVWSTDHTMKIGTCTTECEPDTWVKWMDAQTGVARQLAYCGTPCHYRFLAWLDERTFMFVDHNDAFGDPEQNQIVALLVLYSVGSGGQLEHLGTYRGPAVGKAELQRCAGKDR